MTDPAYNASNALQVIPNMDGFPNGRRLEDDVTRIELQAVGGIVLAAIGLWYDDFDTLSSAVTTDLLGVYGYTTGVESNDTTFRTGFPFVQTPWKGNSNCLGKEIAYTQPAILPGSVLGMIQYNTIPVEAWAYPNPLSNSTVLTFTLDQPSKVEVQLMSLDAKLLSETVHQSYSSKGEYNIKLNTEKLASGVFFAKISIINDAGKSVKALKLVKN